MPASSPTQGHSASFPRNRPREGGGRVQGHTGVWTRAAVVLPIPLGPGAPVPGRAAPAPTWPKAQAGNPTSSLPPSPSPRAAPSPGGPEAPPSARAKQDLSLSRPGPNPRFNPFPARAASGSAFPAAGTQRSGRETRRGLRTLTPLLRDDRLFAREGRAGRWADKWGDERQTHVPWCRGAGGSQGPAGSRCPGGAGPGRSM